MFSHIASSTALSIYSFRVMEVNFNFSFLFLVPHDTVESLKTQFICSQGLSSPSLLRRRASFLVISPENPCSWWHRWVFSSLSKNLWHRSSSLAPTASLYNVHRWFINCKMVRKHENYQKNVATLSKVCAFSNPLSPKHHSTLISVYLYTVKAWSFNFMSRSLRHHKAKHTALANGKSV